MSKLVLERDGAIAWLRMNRPEAHNAFDADMTETMGELVARLARDETVRAVILCGNGPSFSTGVDVKALAQGGFTAESFLAWHRMARGLAELPAPLIMALHGHCLGGGAMLTLAADYRLAAEDLQIGLGAVRHGIIPGSAPELLPAIVGAAAARRLCLFGEYVDAQEALRIGLVDRVVPRGARHGRPRAGRARVRPVAGCGTRVQGADRPRRRARRGGLRTGLPSGAAALHGRARRVRPLTARQ